MNKTKTEEAMKALTMLLMYLSCFTEQDRFSNKDDFYAWKGYDFDIINKMADASYIRQGSHPFRSKSVYITEISLERAGKLMKKYGIEDDTD